MVARVPGQPGCESRRSAAAPDEIRDYTDAESRTDRHAELAGKPSTEPGIEEISVLRPQVHALIAQRAQGARPFVTHNFAGSFDGHPTFNWQATAGAIYVVRNPLDVAVSMTYHFGLTQDEAIERLGDDRVASINDAVAVSHLIGSWSTHVSGRADAAAQSPCKIVVLRYEDLLEKTGQAFREGRKADRIGTGQGAHRTRDEAHLVPDPVVARTETWLRGSGG